MSSVANGRNPYSIMRGGALGTTLVGVVLMLIVITVLYYLYNWLISADASQMTTPILSGPAPMGAAASAASVGGSGSGSGSGGSGSCGTSASTVGSANITKIMDGGQYSVTFWVYVSDTKGFLTAGGSPLAHLLEITDGTVSSTNTLTRSGKTLLFVGLNPLNGSLVVRQNTGQNGEKIDNTLSALDSNGNYPVSHIISNYNQNTTAYQTKDKCDITNGIEYQRWVMIGVVGNGRTLDVYIDGKLARSCVYKANWALGNGQGKGVIELGYSNGDALRGFFSNANYYNWALNPEEMWRTYQSGPGGPFNLWNWISQYFNVTLNVNNQAMAQISPCTACANS